MAIPYVGEIRMFAGNFAPAGWNFCDGSLLSIAENETLFNLIGTTYGGDGQSTFAVPDLRGRVPVHLGNGFTLAENGGTESVVLQVSQMPPHTHAFQASTAGGNQNTPVGSLPATNNTVSIYTSNPPNGPMAAEAVSSFGGSQAHENLQPYLCISFIISLFGIFPSQT